MGFKDTLTLQYDGSFPKSITLSGETGGKVVKLEVERSGETVAIELDETELLRVMTMLVQAGFALRGVDGKMPFVTG